MMEASNIVQQRYRRGYQDLSLCTSFQVFTCFGKSSLYQRIITAFTSTTKGAQDIKASLTAAVAELEKAVALNPYNCFYHLALADGLDAVGRYDETLKSLHKALIEAP